MTERAAPLVLQKEAIGWGLIGASRVARRFMIDAMLQQEPLPRPPHGASSWIVGIYSRNSSRGRAFANDTYLAQVFETLDALLSRPEVQAVYVSSHPRYQAEMTLAAMRAGKHVLCEPPLTFSFEQMVEIRNEAERRNLLVAVNYALRTHPMMTKITGLLQNFAIGEILGARVSNTDPLPFELQGWRLESDGGGVLYDRTLHSIDLVRWLLADEVDQVHSSAGKPFLSEAGEVVEDLLAALRLRRSGISVQLHDSFVMMHQHSTLEIYGTGGTLFAYRWWQDRQGSQLLLVRHDDVEPVPIAKSNPYREMVAIFNEGVRRRNQPQGPQRLSPVLATLHESIRTLIATLAVEASLQDGQRIDMR